MNIVYIVIEIILNNLNITIYRNIDSSIMFDCNNDKRTVRW